MKIAIIGTGYVGLTSGACFAELGHNITCVDRVAEKIDMLKHGSVPIYEPGLEKLIYGNTHAGRLSFTTELGDAIKDTDIAFLAVGTPTNEKDGSADISYIMAAAEEIASLASHDMTIVTKSTVPVGTGEKLAALFKEKRPDLNFHICSNPEFLREGSAVEDTLHPDRIVVGTSSEHAAKQMKELYTPLTEKGVPLILTTIPTAELLKYAANGFLATKLGFVNEMANICEKVGANVTDITRGMGLDKRIGSTYLNPGPGFGGSCLPKDTLALAYIAKEAGAPTAIVESVIASNDNRKLEMVDKIVNACGGDINGKTLSILGLTFKANTDDMRQSPSLTIIPELLKKGAKLKVYDPIGMEEAKKWLPADKLEWCANVDDALKASDGAVILTEWAEFKELDLKKASKPMHHPTLVDLRNVFDESRAKEAGMNYVSVGR